MTALCDRRDVLAGAAVLAIAAGSVRAQSFTFDSGTQNWRVYNISYLGQPLNNPQPVESPAFDASSGLPAGSLRVIDLAGETWVGITDASITGNKAAYYGTSSVSYDILYRTRDEENYAAVGLLGGGRTLYQAKPQPPLNVWLHWDFPLIAGEWRVGSISGPIATEAEIRALLADFRGLFIHTEWKTGPDDTNVDNVVFGPATSPTCPTDYNRDNALNLDDISDFITDFYSTPTIPGGLQPLAPQYPDLTLGFGLPCPNAPDAPAPYAPDAYRASGYRVGFSTDGSNSCPTSPDQNFPSLDNLAEFITEYYAAFTAGGC